MKRRFGLFGAAALLVTQPSLAAVPANPLAPPTVKPVSYTHSERNFSCGTDTQDPLMQEVVNVGPNDFEGGGDFQFGISIRWTVMNGRPHRVPTFDFAQIGDGPDPAQIYRNSSAFVAFVKSVSKHFMDEFGARCGIDPMAMPVDGSSPQRPSTKNDNIADDPNRLIAG